MLIWSILGHLVYFCVLVCCARKDLATLIKRRTVAFVICNYVVATFYESRFHFKGRKGLSRLVKACSIMF
jgi:hypothetical protein